MRPGLEVKYACESAERVGAQLKFLGPELHPQTWESLIHETRFNLPDYLLRRFQYAFSPYSKERQEFNRKVALVGPAAFTEKCLDSYQMNWIIANLEIFFPNLKRIFVDKRDEEIFNQIDRSKGNRVVVLVNQWHMEGIEHHWAHRYGQIPRSVHI